MIATAVPVEGTAIFEGEIREDGASLAAGTSTTPFNYRAEQNWDGEAKGFCIYHSANPAIASVQSTIDPETGCAASVSAAVDGCITLEFIFGDDEEACISAGASYATAFIFARHVETNAAVEATTTDMPDGEHEWTKADVCLHPSKIKEGAEMLREGFALREVVDYGKDLALSRFGASAFISCAATNGAIVAELEHTCLITKGTADMYLGANIVMQGGLVETEATTGGCDETEALDTAQYLRTNTHSEPEWVEGLTAAQVQEVNHRIAEDLLLPVLIDLIQSAEFEPNLESHMIDELPSELSKLEFI